MDIKFADVASSGVAIHLSFKTIGGTGIVGSLLGQSCGWLNDQIAGISGRLQGKARKKN